jgi:hypothetical protein
LIKVIGEKMSFHSRLQRQIGGLYTAVIPFNGSDPIYQSAFASVLEETIRHEAKVHGAAFDKSGFQNVLKALSAKNSRHELNGIEALFFVAGWDRCNRKLSVTFFAAEWAGHRHSSRHLQ